MVETGLLAEVISPEYVADYPGRQVARAVLGRLEFQRGNVEAALKVFDGIDISSIVPRLRVAGVEKSRHRRGKKQDVIQPQAVHDATLLLEATHLKARCLEKLARLPGT